MSITARILLDEHVGRVFERVLRERGYRVAQAKDRFGERTNDRELLQWCEENEFLLLTNNAKDFELCTDEKTTRAFCCITTNDFPIPTRKGWCEPSKK